MAWESLLSLALLGAPLLVRPLRSPRVTSSGRLTPGPITGRGLSGLRVVGDRVHVAAFRELPARPLHPGLEGRPGRMGRDQAVAPRADQVAPPGREQCLTDLEVILRLEELEQRPLEL